MVIQIALINVALVVSACMNLSQLYAQRSESQLERCARKTNPDYDRQALLEEFERILKDSIPAYAQFPSRGFFVYDLNDPTNKYIPAGYAQASLTINFIDNHVYHFAPVEFIFSESHIAVLEDGKVRVFKSINCKNSKERLTDVIAYVSKRLKKDGDREELLTRVRDYRKYGFYFNIDSPRVPCERD